MSILPEIAVSNREIVTTMMERQVGNLYSQLKDQALSVISSQPLIKKVAENYINVNEPKWIAIIQEKLDLAIEATFIDPNISVEDALTSIDELINLTIGQFLQSKLNIPTDTINIGLQALLGVKL